MTTKKLLVKSIVPGQYIRAVGKTDGFYRVVRNDPMTGSDGIITHHRLLLHWSDDAPPCPTILPLRRPVEVYA